jgi:hypothetical protein
VMEEWQQGSAPEAANGGGSISSPFYRGWGIAGEGSSGGVTAALIALTPLKMGVRLRGGMMAG